MSKIKVQETEITVMQVNNEDYLCLTDMLKAKDGDFFITDWLRNRNTLEYIGIWEKVYNPNFNYGEFATIKSHSGLNSFKISVKEFVERTNAISLQAKAGRYGRTYAHKDIAFEYRIHTDAIKQNLIPNELTAQQKSFIYANDGLPQRERLEKLNKITIQQMKVLKNVDDRMLLTDGESK